MCNNRKIMGFLSFMLILCCFSGCSSLFVVDVQEAFMVQKPTEFPNVNKHSTDIPLVLNTPKQSETAQQKTEPSPATTEPQPFPIVDYETVKPNEVGRIMIIMYHGIVATTPPTSYQRTADDFRTDLKTLYEKGYRLVSMNDIVSNNISVEAGKTPVVITFDDGLPSEFSFSPDKKNGEYIPVEDCGIDILNKFCEEYPDFGKAATLFVNDRPFGSVGTFKEKFDYLIKNGYDIGNHTQTHPIMSKLSKDALLSEYGSIDKLIKDNTNDYTPTGIAYPNGIRPAKELRYTSISGEFETHSYTYKYGLAVGDNGLSASPSHIDFEPMYLPRCRASSDDPAKTDLWGLLGYFDNNPSARYISDGNADVIAVPKANEHLVNKDSLNGLKLVFY